MRNVAHFEINTQSIIPVKDDAGTMTPLPSLVPK